MKNQKLKNLVKKSNLLEQTEDFSVIGNIHSQALKGGGDGICDNKGCTVILTIDIDFGCKPYNDGCNPNQNKGCC